MLDQQKIDSYIAFNGVIKCPTACCVTTRGVKLTLEDKQQLNRHQQIQNKIHSLKELLFKLGPTKRYD